MGGITGLSHVTLATASLDRSFAFYTDILGAKPRARWATGAYLDLGTIWLCLAEGLVRPSKDYTHLSLACEAEDFAALSASITEATTLWQENSGEGASLFFLDPDRHRLELHQGNLATRLDHYRANPSIGVTLFDET